LREKKGKEGLEGERTGRKRSEEKGREGRKGEGSCPFKSLMLSMTNYKLTREEHRGYMGAPAPRC